MSKARKDPRRRVPESGQKVLGPKSGLSGVRVVGQVRGSCFAPMLLWTGATPTPGGDRKLARRV